MEFQKINKLIEIESNLRAFSECLNQRNTIALGVEFNNILKSLKKRVKYIYDSPQDVIDVMIKAFRLKKDFATKKTRYREDYVLPRQIAVVIIKLLPERPVAL